MNFLRFLIIFFLITLSAKSENNIPVKYIDISRIVNDSVVGKKIKEVIMSDRKKLNDKHSNLEKKLEKQKNEILAKKNILSDEEFKNEVGKHQESVSKYQLQRKQDLEKMSQKNIKLSRDFMIKVDKIVIEYSKKNSIDLLLKKDALIVSNSSLDITNDILTEVNKNIKKID